MALLTTWTAANRYDSTGLKTTYATETVETEYAGGVDYAYKHTRTRTKNYQYVGLSKEAAYNCVAAMNAKYLRWRLPWKVTITTPTAQTFTATWSADGTRKYREPTASASASHDAGHIWHVDVQVNEVVEVYSAEAFTETSQIDALISETYANFGEADWDYDED